MWSISSLFGKWSFLIDHPIFSNWVNLIKKAQVIVLEVQGALRAYFLFEIRTLKFFKIRLFFCFLTFIAIFQPLVGYVFVCNFLVH